MTTVTSTSTRTDTAAAVESLRAELEGLVRIAARRPNLTVSLGMPGSGWSFCWDTDTVSVNPVHLQSFAPDLCRGLALHEAAHAAVTVLHEILAAAHLEKLLPLLNTLEDIRIEVWMRARFPGAASWIRAYNDVFYGVLRSEPLPQSRQVQFLCGVLELWWCGTTRPGMFPEVVGALDERRTAIAAAAACQPPLDHDAAGILASQRAMWEIVRQRILPAWERLVMLDRREGIERIAKRELRQFTCRTGCERQRSARGSARLRPADRRGRPIDAHRTVPKSAGRRPQPSHHGDDAGSVGGEKKPAGETPSLPADNGSYLAAWRRIAPVADRLGDELLRLLVPQQRLRWSAGHASGPRIDLRRAMQFEADPQLYRSLWRRPILPYRRDPAILLLVDRSSSMHEDQRNDRALEGTVLLTEVCRRIGVASAVWSFGFSVTEDLAWDATVDDAARRRIGLMSERSENATNMAAALAAVGRAFAARHGDPKLLFVISDGTPDEHEPTLAAVRQLEAEGIATVGLGLGPGTANLAGYFQTAVTEIHPERLVDHVADLLNQAVSTTVASGRR